jgi:glycogen(starch) synthase
MAAETACLVPALRSGDTRGPRQRVLMTADTVGGVWQYALELSRALIADGHDVVLATMGAMPDRSQRLEAAAVSGLVLYPSAYKLLWMPDCWRDVRAAGEWLLNLAAAVQPTVVHLNDFGHGDLPWKVPTVLVAHSCVMSWWRAVHTAPAPAEWRRYRESVCAALKAADLVVAPSAAMSRALRRHYGMQVAARVIPNGRSGEGDGAPRSKAEYIFSAGRIGDEAKNIAALGAVAGRLPWPVCIAGTGQRPDGTPVAFKDAHMLGRLATGQVRQWLARAPIYAAPARYEPFGLSILEAALARCALVLGDIDSLREIWGDAAVFVDPNDHDALEHALRQLISNRNERDRYAALAYARAQRYTPAAMAAHYAAAYAQLTTEQGGEAVALQRVG